MIPLFDADGARNPHTYNGYTLNQDIGGSKKDIVEINYVQPQSIIEQTTERLEFTDGLEVYGAYKRAKRILMSGIVRASSAGALYDRLEELAAAFDPSLVSRNNPTDFGFLPYDFDVPTADTATYATGIIPCRFYVRAEAAIEPPFRIKGNLGIPFRMTLLAADPRRYTQSTEQLAGAGTADNSKASYYSWPTVVIAMSGAGSANFAIGNSTAGETLTLDLSSLSNGDSVAVDMQRESITLGGVDAPDLFVSGGFFWMEPGSNTITVANTTNASATTTWRPAFSF